jgi:hypothetical protein
MGIVATLTLEKKKPTPSRQTELTHKMRPPLALSFAKDLSKNQERQNLLFSKKLCLHFSQTEILLQWGPEV